MGSFQKLVVQLQPVMDQPTRVISPQNRLRLIKTPSRQNLAIGDLLSDHSPEPAQLRVDLPAGLVHTRQHTTPGSIPQCAPSGFGFARHPLDSSADAAPAHRLPET